MPRSSATPLLDPEVLGAGTTVTQRALDCLALAHDASHYLLVPGAVLTPTDASGVARIFEASHAGRRAITFRSGGTSLSGQAVSDSVLVDVRKQFRAIDVGSGGHTVRVQPGATVRQTNLRLARFGRKLGPDPASEIACTIGGVIANNSSGMACGIEQNSYQTLQSMVLVLPSGTVIDSSEDDADAQLRAREPDLHAGLTRLRDQVVSSPHLVAELRRQYSMKNTMGYGLNSLLDFDAPVDILTHLMVGSEGTLGFVAEAVFRTVEVLPCTATGLLVFHNLSEATRALPDLVRAGLATIELMDAQSLRVAQRQPDAPSAIAQLVVEDQAAYLIELQARTSTKLLEKQAATADLFASLPLASALSMTTDPVERASLWHVRKGLYTAVAGARPSGTTALLEDIAVPVDQLLSTCQSLTAMFAEHGYEGSVIFGHAKDGNVHFLLNEDFGDADKLARYRRFTEQLVDLVLSKGGSLKAEHGTGRVMAPFVRRQFGEELYGVMLEVKRLCDPTGLLNPDVLLSSDALSYMKNLKLVPSVEAEVDRCVECGYCEPTCPSKNITLTPRQRIVVRREMQSAQARDDVDLLDELNADYEYDGLDTCAVDGLCKTSCPVGINTGDLVRRLRAEDGNKVEHLVWKGAAKIWGPVTLGGSLALSTASRLPAPLVTAATKVGRAVVGPDTVPLYDRDLPAGGSRRPRAVGAANDAEAVFFAACIGTMFGPAQGSRGVTAAFLELCRRAGVALSIPSSLERLCCGTPWKSKGHLDGYADMTNLVLPRLLEASLGGELPIVCDAASCTEGLQTMRGAAAKAGGHYTGLQFIDSVDFVHDRVLPALNLTRPVSSIAVHHTCSTVALGTNAALTAVAQFVSDDVFVPLDWGCCAFAGDRGLLHPELTASATAAEAAALGERVFEEYVSANRTCEIGMSRATGHQYRHVLEVLERATRTIEHR
jgi:D-lactate dehydrogenase